VLVPGEGLDKRNVSDENEKQPRAHDGS
jgi:hypothetical protein